MRWEALSFSELDTSTLYKMMELRQEVFVVEQDCPYMDADGDDLFAIHLMGWKGEQLVAYLRMFEPSKKYVEASIGRVVTSPSVRGEGLGIDVMKRGIDYAHTNFVGTPIRISAQTRLRRFYENLGFEVVGEGYLEDGIPHLPMVKQYTVQ
jgi:ElaA protein